MRAFIVMAAACLSACSPSQSERAEQELAMVQSATHSDADLCEAMKKVAAAYLKEGNAQEYDHAKFVANAQCMLVK